MVGSIAFNRLDHAANKSHGFFFGYSRDHEITSVRSMPANYPVSDQNEPVVGVGDMGLVYI